MKSSVYFGDEKLKACYEGLRESKVEDKMLLNWISRAIEDVEGCIVRKTNFAIELYDKYRFNLKEKNALLQSGKIFDWGKERDLLLSEIDDTDFYSFLNEFQVFLKKIVKDIG